MIDIAYDDLKDYIVAMKKLLLILAVTVVGFLTGCTTIATTGLESDGTGSGIFAIDFHPAVMGYLSDFALGLGMEADGLGEFIDEQLLQDRIDSWDGVELSSVSKGIQDAEVTLEITDFTRFADSLGDFDGIPGLVSSTNDPDSTITITLDPWIIQRIIETAVPGGNTFVDVFGPQAQDPYTEDEYREIVDYAFEEYLDSDETEDIINDAYFELSIHVPGEITSVLGGSRHDGNTAVFTIPFIEIVTLDRTVEWLVSYK